LIPKFYCGVYSGSLKIVIIDTDNLRLSLVVMMVSTRSRDLVVDEVDVEERADTQEVAVDEVEEAVVPTEETMVATVAVAPLVTEALHVSAALKSRKAIEADFICLRANFRHRIAQFALSLAAAKQRLSKTL
jgi:hypothetical protein